MQPKQSVICNAHLNETRLEKSNCKGILDFLKRRKMKHRFSIMMYDNLKS